MKNLIAQIPLAPPGGYQGFGRLGLEGGGDAPSVFNQVLSTTIGVMTVVAFIWFVINFFLGAIGILASGGDKQKLAEARAKLTSSIIGLIVVVVAIFLINLLGDIIGIPNILNPAEFINNPNP